MDLVDHGAAVAVLAPTLDLAACHTRLQAGFPPAKDSRQDLPVLSTHMLTLGQVPMDTQVLLE